jgi:2-(1,2-epoxy-1,2-dihydrophenyl)acetyl-CoA isomerase
VRPALVAFLAILPGAKTAATPWMLAQPLSLGLACGPGELAHMKIIELADQGHVRTITLNRPEKKNALSDELAWGVVEAIDAAARDDNVWVVAITGSGDSFCAGLDLTGGERYSPHTPQTAQLDDIHWVGHFLLAIRKRCDKPVVAGVNGVAVGAGLGLAMAADVRLVSRSARLMAGYTRIGGSPDAGLTITLPQAMGYEQALRFMMENRTVQGEEAVRLGMAGEVVDDADFAARLAEYCQQLCQWSPITLRLLKRGLVKALDSTDMEQQLRYELANIRIAFGSEDAQEARRAFLDKRSPTFRGR